MHRTELKLGSVITSDIIWLRGKKCVIYRLDIIFSITHVSKINLFCQRDIRRYRLRDIWRKIPNFIPCQELVKWEWLIVSLWHLLTYLKKLQFMLTETRQISNLRSQDVSKEISISNMQLGKCVRGHYIIIQC